MSIRNVAVPAPVVPVHSRPEFRPPLVPTVKSTFDNLHIVTPTGGLPTDTSNVKYVDLAREKVKNALKMCFYGAAASLSYTLRVVSHSKNQEGKLQATEIGTFTVTTTGTGVTVNGGTFYPAESIVKLSGNGQISGGTAGANALLGIDVWNAQFLSVSVKHASDTGTFLVYYHPAEAED